MGNETIISLAGAALAGLIAGWLVGRSRGAGMSKAEKLELEAKLSSYERELDKSLGDLRMQREQVNLLMKELAASTEKLKVRDAEATLNRPVELNAELVLEINCKDQEIAALKASLAEIEAVAVTKADHAASPNGNGDVIASLQLRLGELEAANAKIGELEAANAKIGEIEASNAKIGELETAHAKIAELEAKLLSSNADRSVALSDKDAAISLLQMKIKGMEPLGAQVAQRDSRIGELERRLQFANAEKDADLARLRMRVNDLESKLQSADGEKVAEIAKLRLRLTEHESATARAHADMVKVKEVEELYHAEIGDKEVEIAQLKARVNELGRLDAQLFLRDTRILELESRLQSMKSDNAEEIDRLIARIEELEAAARTEASDIE